MDIRLREITQKPAGTYFLLTDSSPVPEFFSTGKLRLFVINSKQGPVNTVVLFKKGEKTAFQNIFGKRLRKNEKLGNFSIYNVLEALNSSDVAVINLRKFTDEDKVGIVGLSPNKTESQSKDIEYTKLFNTNGFWTVRAKNIAEQLDDQLLNFGNVGKSNISFFVTKSTNYDTQTKHGDLTLANTPLEIEEYPALNPEMLLSETFVDVYVFNNTFDTNSRQNKYYGHLINDAGLLTVESIDSLSKIPEAGFVKKMTGSLIPNLVNEFGENISIDSVVNASYSETGLVCYINDDVLEFEELDGLPVINSELKGYYKLEGDLVDVGNYLSYRAQVVEPYKINISDVKTKDIKSLQNEFIVSVNANSPEELFPDTEDRTRVYSVFENQIRLGDSLYFKDTTSGKIEKVEVIGLELPEDTGHRNLPNTDGNMEYTETGRMEITEVSTTAVTLNIEFPSEAEVATIYRSTFETGNASDNKYEKIGTLKSGTREFKDTNIISLGKYVYSVTFSQEGKLTSGGTTPKYADIEQLQFGDGKGTEIQPEPVKPISTQKWNKLILKLSGKLNADSYVRQLDIEIFKQAKVAFTNLKAYVPREEQFLDGTASRQREILDVILEPGILKGLKNLNGLKYIVDCFKSYIEAGYKYQFGQLTVELDKVNKFVRCFVNEPFYEDFNRSSNPLFKDTPNGSLNLVDYLATGGNPAYSTVFLNKFGTGAENCYFFGSESDATDNEYPLSGKISNLFVQKTNFWDIVANTTGYIDGVKAIPFNPDEYERGAMEKFKWNPVISTNKGFTIFGNMTGQKTSTSLAQIHNSELLSYIKEQLEKMSRDEAFKKGSYSEFIATQTEYQSFMNELAQVGAIQPNPVVICSAVNNPPEVTKQKIKVIHIEYTAIDGIEKVVFDLKLN